MFGTTARVTLFVGNYGSGKTEIALNEALYLRNAGHKTALVDLDIVNPYFRSAEHSARLTSHGIRMLAPTFALTAVDVPALPAEIQSVFDIPDERVVFDVGGDDTGATALGRYHPSFAREAPAVLFVVNTCRPLSRTPADILDLMARVTSRGRLRPTGLINNTNLADETTPALLLAGQRTLEVVAAQSGIPIMGITGTRDVLAQMPHTLSGLCKPIVRYMKPEFFD